MVSVGILGMPADPVPGTTMTTMTTMTTGVHRHHAHRRGDDQQYVEGHSDRVQPDPERERAHGKVGGSTAGHHHRLLRTPAVTDFLNRRPRTTSPAGPKVTTGPCWSSRKRWTDPVAVTTGPRRRRPDLVAHGRALP